MTVQHYPDKLRPRMRSETVPSEQRSDCPCAALLHRERIVENYVAFKTRNESKEKAEAAYEDTKQYLGETPTTH